MARTKKVTEEGAPIIIKKYANRRLYNTHSSKYITLDFIAELIREGQEFSVVDAKTGEDITHNVLTQIVVEEENGGEGMLPVGFLKQLISLYGQPLQSQVPEFLDNAIHSFRAGRNKLEDAVEQAVSAAPFGDIAAQNIKMARQARDAILGHVTSFSGKSANSEDVAPVLQASELDDIKRQMEDLQAKLEALSNK